MKTVHTMMIGIALSALSASSMALPAKEIGSWTHQTCKEVMAPLVVEGVEIVSITAAWPRAVPIA